jgi:hypothetical protein
MSHHTATLQATSQTIASLYNASLAITDQLLWLDETYFQPFVKWVAPRLQDAAVSALVWTVISIIKFCLWLVATIERWAATDAIAIALMAWAQAYAPAEDVLAIVAEQQELHHALLLPSVEMAIAADNVQGNEADTAIDPWGGDCDWEYSPLMPPVQSRKAIALLPPAKRSQASAPSSKGKTKKTPAKPSQKSSGKGKSQPSSSAARTPCKPTQTSRGARYLFPPKAWALLPKNQSRRHPDSNWG